ncbi:response regulator [bacterium]|nr:response regulator [bacterium]
MEQSKKISVLYVDDETPNLSAFKANFRKQFNVHLAESVNQALEIMSENEVDVVITDHMMPGRSGVDLLEQLKETDPYICRILITGCSDINIVIEAINRGEVFRFLTKPWVKDVLASTIQSGYENMQEKKKEQRLNDKLLETNQQLEFMLRQKLIS